MLRSVLVLACLAFGVADHCGVPVLGLSGGECCAGEAGGGPESGSGECPDGHAGSCCAPIQALSSPAVLVIPADACSLALAAGDCPAPSELASRLLRPPRG